MIGTHFANECHQRGFQTFGLVRNSAASRLADLPNPDLCRADIIDRDAVETVVTKIQPDLVVHLAAQAYNGISWECDTAFKKFWKC